MPGVTPLPRETSSQWRLWAAILAAAGLLYFWGLSDRGLLEWDAAYYLGVARTARVGLDWLAERILFGVSADLLRERLLQEGVAVNATAKHGFVLLLVAGSYFFGLGERLSLFISAFFGLATIGVTGRVARILFNRWVGALAMALAALSFTQLHYSRSGLPVTAPTFFVCLGWLLVLTQRDFWAGLSIGFALTCHYNLFWVPPLFFLFLLRQRAEKGMTFAGGALLPPLFFEGGTRLVQWFVYQTPALVSAFQGREGKGRFFSYLEDLYFQTLGQGTSFTGREPFFYLNLMVQWEGILTAGALGVALLWFIRRSKKNFSMPQYSCWVLTVLPLIIWSSFSHPVARAIGVAVPAGAILLAAWSEALYQRIKVHLGKMAPPVGWGLLGAVVAAGCLHLAPLLAVRSGMPEAVTLMRQSGSVKHISSEFPLSRLYVGRLNALDTTLTFYGKDPTRVLSSLYDDGYRFVLMASGRFTSDPNLVKMLEGVRPIFRVPHAFRLSGYEYFNHNGTTREKVLSAPQQIEIYTISDILRGNRA